MAAVIVRLFGSYFLLIYSTSGLRTVGIINFEIENAEDIFDYEKIYILMFFYWPRNQVKETVCITLVVRYS